MLSMLSTLRTKGSSFKCGILPSLTAAQGQENCTVPGLTSLCTSEEKAAASDCGPKQAWRVARAIRSWW